MKLAIDAMGGDHAPHEIIKGAMRAAEASPDMTFLLVGDQTKIEPLLDGGHPQFEIIHTTEVIEATDSPVKAVRRKSNASMVLAINEVKEGRAEAVISAGNTGALMAAGLFSVGRINGIDRPALAPTLPTIKKDVGCLFLDVGSNMDARPEHVLQYAIMGSIYSEKVLNNPNPRIGLLNVGEEPGKGNDLSKEAYKLLKDAPINFIGNVESRDILQGVADIVVTDGFSGNLVLKSIEGTAMALFTLIKEELSGSFFSKLIAGLLYKKLKTIQRRFDHAAYGGACLFGLAAPVIKAHGSSNAEAIFTAIQQAKLLVERDVVKTIEKTVLEKKDLWTTK